MCLVRKLETLTFQSCKVDFCGKIRPRDIRFQISPIFHALAFSITFAFFSVDKHPSDNVEQFQEKNALKFLDTIANRYLIFQYFKIVSYLQLQ